MGVALMASVVHREMGVALLKSRSGCVIGKWEWLK